MPHRSDNNVVPPEVLAEKRERGRSAMDRLDEAIRVGDLERQRIRHEAAQQRARVRWARLQVALAVPFFVGLVVGVLECTKEDPNDWIVLACVCAMIPLVSTFELLGGGASHRR